MNPKQQNRYNAILQKLDEVIEASDAFENARGKLSAHLDEITDLPELKARIKEVFELRRVASDKHKEFYEYLHTSRNQVVDKDFSEFHQSLGMGYKTLREIIRSKLDGFWH